jgi:hypothetical protein
LLRPLLVNAALGSVSDSDFGGCGLSPESRERPAALSNASRYLRTGRVTLPGSFQSSAENTWQFGAQEVLPLPHSQTALQQKGAASALTDHSLAQPV